MLKLTSSAIALVWISAVLAPQARAQGFNHIGLASQVLEQHIKPGYQRLHESAKTLEKAASAFCSAKAPANLAPVRTAFKETVLAWSGVSHLRFGPIAQERRLTRMLYWPDRKNLGRKQVRRAIRSRTKSTLTLESLNDKSVAMQGLGAIEQLLYWKADDVFDKSGEDHVYRCGYLTTATKNVANISGELVSGWSSDAEFPKTLLSPGNDNPRYLKPSEVTLEISKAFLVGLERLRDIKVVGALGMRPNSRARLSVPFEMSKLSTRAMQAELEGLIDMYENGGLLQVIENQESGMGKSINFEFKQALAAFKRISLPIAKAVQDTVSENNLIDTGFPLKNARQEAARVLSQAAGLSLGFNALDGD